MKLIELIEFMGRFFEKEKVDYFIFGATAMNFWAPPRNTVDLDAVVAVDKRRGVAFLDQLRKSKFPITKDQSRKFFEGRIVQIPLGDTQLDLKICKTRHEREALARARSFDHPNYRLRIASPEDLVLFKLQAWRRQDQADLERLVQHRKDLDLTYIRSWLGPIEEGTGFPMAQRWDEFRKA